VLDYWTNRLKSRFRPVANLEQELARTYAAAYETITKDYLAILKPFTFKDGTIDWDALGTELKLNRTKNYTLRRYNNLLQTIDSISADLGSHEINTIETLLKNTYKNNYYDVLFQMEKRFGYKMEFSLLSKERLAQVIKTKWSADGSEFSGRIWSNKYQLRDNLRSLITESIATGRDPNSTALLLQQSTNSTLYNSKRIVRTETMALITESDTDAFQEAGVDKYEILAAFDKRTSRICQQQDGKQYLIREKKIGVNAPPFHPNCRTTITPVLGEEPPTTTRFARDATGKPIKIARDMTYENYKKNHLIPDGE
jgi:SPP1 gp7 family putative phage head morphogenesis protein